MSRHLSESSAQHPHTSVLADRGAARQPKRASKARASSLDAVMLFECLADSSRDVFWMADRSSNRLLYLSARFAQWWGVDVAAAMEDPLVWNRAVVAADASRLPRPFFADAEDGALDSIREYRIVGSDGQVRWLRDRRFQVRSTDGQAVCTGGLAEDITERKERERFTDAALENERVARVQAEEKAHARDEFMAVVTHELRSPLNAIRGWAHVLRQSGSLNPMQTKALDAVDRNTHAQAQMVSDLLDSQSILCGKLQLIKHRLPLATLVDEAVEAVQTVADAKRIDLDVAHAPGGVEVHADADRLRRALVVVLSNAVKFTLDGGVVQVRTQVVGEQVDITVHDTGIGLDADRMPSLFDRFIQADPARTRRQGGLGLGLSLACQLMALHGGRITAHSDGLGKGATFTLSLPCGDSQAATDTPHPRVFSAVDQPLLGRVVMLVEDEDDAREALEIILRSAGADVSSFSRAALAYEHLTRLPPHSRPNAVLSDIAMPDEDGYAFIQRVRAFEKVQGLPSVLALAVTAFSQPGDQQRAADAGFNAHLAKPLDAQVLVPTLCAAMDTSHGTSHEDSVEGSEGHARRKRSP